MFRHIDHVRKDEHVFYVFKTWSGSIFFVKTVIFKTQRFRTFGEQCTFNIARIKYPGRNPIMLNAVNVIELPSVWSIRISLYSAPLCIKIEKGITFGCLCSPLKYSPISVTTEHCPDFELTKEIQYFTGKLSWVFSSKLIHRVYHVFGYCIPIQTIAGVL